MQNGRIKRVVCLIMALYLLISCAPFIYAVDFSGLFGGLTTETIQLDDSCKILNYVDEKTFLSGKHIGRLKNQEKLDTYVFQNRDGTRTVYYMSGPVKYRGEDGIVREKDLTLVEKKGGYGVASSDLDLLLPGSPAKGIDVTHGELTITIIPENVSFAVKQGAVDEDSYVYADCFGNGIDLVYTPTLNGMKEDIVIERYFGKNKFSFLIESNGLRMFSKDGQYYLAGGENADDKLWLGDLLIYDAKGKPGSGTMDVETVVEREQYRVTLTADEAFLTDADTAFPVTVDPTVELEIKESETVGVIEDATVFLNKPSLNANWTYNHVGLYDSNYGVGRTVYRLTGLLADSGYAAATANQITNVTFHVKEASGTPAQTLYLYAMNGNSQWTETGVTYGNYGGYYAGQYVDNDSLPSNDWGEFDITDLAKAWKNGTYNANCGFVLVNPNEGSTAAEKTLYSCEHGDTGSRPYVSATYESGLGLNTSSLELNEGSTSALTLTSGTATSWSSSNTSVATVSNGVVTGVKAGTATITATNLNGLTVTCAVTVKKPSGIYRLDHVSTGLKMGMASTDQGVQKLIVAQNIGSTVYEQYGQLWILHYVGNGYYTVSPSYAQTGNLYMNADYSLSVEAFSSYATQWKVYYEQTGYILLNRYYGKFLYLSSTATVQSEIGISSASTSSVRWNLYSRSVPAGIALYDSDTFSWVNPSKTSYASAGGALKPVCMAHTGQSGTFSVTSGLSMNYSSISDAILVGDSCGETTATVSHSCGQSIGAFPLRVVLPLSGSELPYQPELWNPENSSNPDHAQDLLTAKQWSNCYMYALNMQIDPREGVYNQMPAPGNFADDYTIFASTSGNTCTAATLDNIRTKIILDAEVLNYEIEKVDRDERCPIGTYKIAVVCTEEHDTFHWYRQNADGSWSQKMGSNSVTNLEDWLGYGDIIWDPEEVVIRGNTYEEEYEYFAVTRSTRYMLIQND